MCDVTQPEVVPIKSPDGGPLYKVSRRWVYQWDHEGRRCRLVIAAGTEFDGASVPWWLWTVARIPPDGLHRAAALAHDVVYRFGGHLPEGVHQVQTYRGWRNVAHCWSRAEADRLFARILRECGVSRWRRRVMYRAVRLCGWMHWRPRTVPVV